jgi:hypothetical protein
VNKNNNRDDVAGVFMRLNVGLKRSLGQSEGELTGRRRFLVEKQAMEVNDLKVILLVHRTYEDGTDRVFRNVGTYNFRRR